MNKNNKIKVIMKKILTFVLLFISSISLIQAEVDIKKSTPKEPTSNIIIFSLSHSEKNYTTEPTGTLVIQLNAFSPILKIDINGEAINFKKDTKVLIKYPFHITGGDLKLIVTAKTKQTSKEKTFTFYQEDQASAEKEKFKLITIVGSTHTDNLNSVPSDEDKTSATKYALTLIPKYSFTIGSSSILQIKGIILREQYSNRDYKSEETSYTQLALKWIKEISSSGVISGEVGGNDIKNDNTDITQGEEESAVETYFKADSYMLRYQYKYSNSKTDVSNENDEADAIKNSLYFQFNTTVWNIKNNLSGEYSKNDAMGKYKDYNSIDYGIKFSYPLTNWIFSLSHNQQIKTFESEDSRLGNVAPKNRKSRTTLKCLYMFSKTFFVSLAYKATIQNSNVDGNKYKTNTSNLNFIYIF